MDILRKYLLSNVLRSPDDPVADPAPVAGDDNPQPDPAPSGDPAPDPAPDPDPQPDPAPSPAVAHGNKGKTPWYMERIHEETNKRQAEADRARAAEERASAAEALLLRMQQGDDKTPPKDTPAPKTRDFDSEVEAAAARKLFIADTVAVLNNGVNKFEDFNETRNILGALGALQDDFVADVIGVDKPNAHVILDKLAKDPERTAALVRMDSRSRIAELTRLSMTEQAKPAVAPAANANPLAPKVAVSKAPAPRPVMEPKSDNDDLDWLSPDASPETFSKGWDKKYLRA